MSALIADAMPASRCAGSVQSNVSVMRDPPPLLAGSSCAIRLRFSLARHESTLSPTAYRRHEAGATGEVVSCGDLDESSCTGERLDGALRGAVVVLDGAGTTRPQQTSGQHGDVVDNRHAVLAAEQRMWWIILSDFGFQLGASGM